MSCSRSRCRSSSSRSPSRVPAGRRFSAGRPRSSRAPRALGAGARNPQGSRSRRPPPTGRSPSRGEDRQRGRTVRSALPRSEARELEDPETARLTPGPSSLSKERGIRSLRKPLPLAGDHRVGHHWACDSPLDRTIGGPRRPRRGSQRDRHGDRPHLSAARGDAGAAAGVLYLLAVSCLELLGHVLGLATAIVSAAAFNFFHIPPTGRFTIAEGENWVALAVFLVGRGRRQPGRRSWRARVPPRPSPPPRGRPRRRDGAAPARGDEPRRLAARPRPAHRSGFRPGFGSIESGVARGDRAGGRCRSSSTAQRAGTLPSRATPTTSSRRSRERIVPRSRRCSPRRASARGSRPRWSRPGHCAARRGQDGAAALGLPRPAHAADRDNRRGRRARLGWARAPSERAELVAAVATESDAAVAAGRPAARLLSAPGRGGRAARATGHRSRRRSGPRSTRSRRRREASGRRSSRRSR